MSPAHAENHMCSHPRTSDAMATAEKNHTKNGRNTIKDFVTRIATTTRWQCNSFKKESYYHHKQNIAHEAAALCVQY